MHSRHVQINQEPTIPRPLVNIMVALFALLGFAVSVVPAAEAKMSPRFFGVSPQAPLTSADTTRMARVGIGSIRTSVSWAEVEPFPGLFDWGKLDATVRLATRSGIEVVPVLHRTPTWLAKRPTTLPVRSESQRAAWRRFLREAVQRYGPGGQFWLEHGPSSLDPLDPQPIRFWQIWNEPNYFYFATPVSPQRYANLLKISAPEIKAVDPGARVIMGGLIAYPDPYPRGMTATRFLRAIYRVDGIANTFDGVAVHPYVPRARNLRRALRPLRRILIRNGERTTGLWITEMGWGSQERSGNFIERGASGQTRQLRAAYHYLTSPARRWLRLSRTYWFSWKDAPGPSCSFCDSVGLLRYGSEFAPKPAWRVFRNFAKSFGPSR